MLFLIFAYYLVRGASIDAGPISSFDSRSLAANHCTDLTHCRTIWNIVWSCFVTIFSCTWVAVHPNIPCPKRRETNSWIERRIWNPLLSFAEHRLPLFVCALLVPEYMLAWAIRQFLKAREIAKSEFELSVKILSMAIILSHSLLLSGRGWTTTHGFFVIMGGFHLFDHGSIEINNYGGVILHEDDIPLHPLTNQDLYDIIGSDIDFYSFTVPTEAEIIDRGKSDWLAKSLVLLQTSWFVMQCIARAIEHLPVTHLEIVTLAYASMNFVIYVFWWDKPLNVNRPVRVFRKSDSGATSIEPQLRETRPQVREPISDVRELTLEAVGNGLETIVRYIVGVQDDAVELSREDGVPMFWANSAGGNAAIADLIVLGVGVCFGAIHCIAWGISFPTHTELLMWRISSIAITAVPIYIPLIFLTGGWLADMGFDTTVFYFGPLSGGILYIIARAITLVLAFISLRDLPPGAYETVHWTTFIPHV